MLNTLQNNCYLAVFSVLIANNLLRNCSLEEIDSFLFFCVQYDKWNYIFAPAETGLSSFYFVLADYHGSCSSALKNLERSSKDYWRVLERNLNPREIGYSADRVWWL